MNKIITITPSDNLAVALADIDKGEGLTVNGIELVAQEKIPAKHKIATIDFAVGDEMTMYGLVVGKAILPIAKGARISTENTKHESTGYQLEATEKVEWQAPDVSKFANRTFMGYHRADGQVGTTNTWLVFPLVFCENKNVLALKKAIDKALAVQEVSPAERLAAEIKSAIQTGSNFEGLALAPPTESLKDSMFPNVNIKFVTHQAGCGGTREDADSMCRLFAGYMKNPNVAGATVLSLGCQNAQVKDFLNAVKAVDPNLDKPIHIFDQQALGNESVLIEKAMKATFQGLIEANKIERKPAPLSKLTIGLECGGSDGFSGISANPALGLVSDMVTALGGKAILSEFPELCGTEQELINRMTKPGLPAKFSGLMKAYAAAAEAAGSGFDMNPSPGNIKDGLITDAMKSAGASKKGGSSPVNDVLDYTEYATADGLSLLCTPGNDVESTTGLGGSGANIILFTTGLGTPTGNPVTPVLKVSSNTKMALKMDDIIDINTGTVIEGIKTLPEIADEMLEKIIKIASGEELCKADINQQEDFIPWKRAVSL